MSLFRLGRVREPLAALLGLCALLLSACQSAPMTPVVIEMNTPTVTVTPTTTPVWFPATDTPSPVPSLTLAPTPDLRPGLGAQILSDDFTTGGWQAYKNEAGKASFGVGELTLALDLAKGVLTSLRSSPLPGDSSFELTASPSLCTANDIFGLYLRAASPQDGYRLLLTCGGQILFERLNHGELVVLQDWTPQMGNMHGGMVPLVIGVWALGKEQRVFINGVYQFTVQDPLWKEGMLGVYAREATDSPLTVSFSGLTVHSIDASLVPTPTPVLTPTRTPHK